MALVYNINKINKFIEEFYMNNLIKPTAEEFHRFHYISDIDINYSKSVNKNLTIQILIYNYIIHDIIPNDWQRKRIFHILKSNNRVNIQNMMLNINICVNFKNKKWKKYAIKELFTRLRKHYRISGTPPPPYSIN